MSAPRAIVYVTIFNWCTDDVNLGFILDFQKDYKILIRSPSVLGIISFVELL